MSVNRNVLFGMLALQMDFVTRDQLASAMNDWALDKSRPLAHFFREQKTLEADTLTLLEALVEKHLAKHGNDAAQSLVALSTIGSPRHDLPGVADADVQDSLRLIASTLPQTGPQLARAAVGESTSAGQRFRFLRPHAEGGLGKVSVAEDGELHREVALKEIKDRYADHADSRARFVLEAVITGGLEHPGIVPVYGLGTYADGRPFYAMRFIRGDSLKEAIKRFHASGSPKFDSLEFRRLLGQFVDACNAIAYAHSRGVLHRDLKPANIMLGKYGETLVVDWGLAKALNRAGNSSGEVVEPPLAPSSGSGTDETLPGQAMGTPEFMSPEQAAGRLDRLGPATDIYGLGATLYAILTDRPPVGSKSVVEILEKVQKGEIVPPRSVIAAVPASLAAVCLKAMALDPRDRYASAQELSADVEHWLADEPVAAWREPISVRTWRWVRRHRTLATTAGVLVMAAAAGLGLLAAERERARSAVAGERDRATAARTRAREALDAMVSGITGDSLATQANLSPEQKTFLQSVLKYYEEFSAEPGEDREGRERLANAHRQLGLIHYQLGQREEGVPVFREAASLYQQLSNDFPTSAEYRRGVVFCNNRLGYLLVALGRRAEAEDAYRAALTVGEQLVAEHPDEADDRHNLAQSRNRLGLLHASVGKRDEAEADYAAALAIWRRLTTEHPADPDYANCLGWCYTNTGLLLGDRGKPAEAEAAYRSSIAVRERLAAEYPNMRDNRHGLAMSYNNLGLLLANGGRRIDAAGAYQTSLTIREKLITEYPAIPDYIKDLGGTFCNLGYLNLAANLPGSALGWHTQAIDRLAPLVAAEPHFVAARQYLRNSHWGRARDLVRLGRYDEALRDWERAIELDEGSEGVRLRIGRAACLAHLGRASDAVAEVEQFAAAKDAKSGTLYGCACVLSLASAAPNNPDADRHAARAIELLRLAIAKGYHDFPTLRADVDLIPLRKRADYTDLLRELGDTPAKTP
jgi:serine/threonine-protein kinase